MNWLRPERLPSALIVGGLAALLVLLALLQYHWSLAVSRADTDRMKAALHSSMQAFSQDFHHEFLAIALSFRGAPPAVTMQGPQSGPSNNSVHRTDSSSDFQEVAADYESWARSAAHPALIADVYIAQPDGAGIGLFRLDHNNGQFYAEDWHSRFPQLPAWIRSATPPWATHSLPAGLDPGIMRPQTEADLGIIHHSEAPPNEAGIFHPEAPPPPPRNEPQDLPGGASMLGMTPSTSSGVIVHSHLPGGPWAIVPEAPAMIHVIAIRPPAKAAGPPQITCVMIELDAAFIRNSLLPELAEHYFPRSGGFDYRVTVMVSANQGKPQETIYTSDSESPITVSTADANLDLWDYHAGPADFHENHGPHFHAHASTDFSAAAFSGSADWRLLAQHRKGSLDAAAASMRRSNLALSFGVLLVLAAGMAVLVIASQRAQRLAQLQMEFVAGVSHELRTPLAVIASAADNLADGVVQSPLQLSRYGAMIRKQAKQLTHLIEHVLLFAAARRNRLQLRVEPIPVKTVLDEALGGAADSVRDGGFRIETSVEAGLPEIMGNPGALSHCLQNIVINAAKYGGADGWIGVQAGRAPARGGRTPAYVRISIADHGTGIPASELSAIFEPFYRSPAVREGNIHGTGLGLSLAKSIAEAVGGRLSVESEPGKGSVFHLDLAAAPGPAQRHRERQEAEVIG